MHQVDQGFAHRLKLMAHATQHEADAAQSWQPANQQDTHMALPPGRHTDTSSLDGKALQICPVSGLLGSVQLHGGLWVKLL